MALSLGVTVGSKLRIGNDILKVLDVVGGRTVSVQIKGKEFVITDEERTEILPEVFVSCGVHRKDWRDSRFSRLAIEAPRSVRISRLPEVPAVG